MSDLWKAADDVYTMMRALISSKPNLVLLAGVEDSILIVFKEKAGKSGDKTILGKTSKAGPLLEVVGDQKWSFVITLAADEWNGLSDKHREALLFHHLCACGATENPQSGEIKTFIRPPDIEFYQEEVASYGFWRTSDTTPDTNTILAIFGTSPSP